MTRAIRIFFRNFIPWIVVGLAGVASISTGFAQESENKFRGGAKYTVTADGPIDPNNIVLNIAQKTDFTLANSKQWILNHRILIQKASLRRGGRGVGSVRIARTLGTDQVYAERDAPRNDRSIKRDLKEILPSVAAAAKDMGRGRKLGGNAKGRAIEFSWNGDRCAFFHSFYRLGHTRGGRNFDTGMELLYCEPLASFDAGQVYEFVENARLVDADDNRAAYTARAVSEANRERSLVSPRQRPSRSTAVRENDVRDIKYCYNPKNGTYKSRSYGFFIAHITDGCGSSQEVTKAQYDANFARLYANNPAATTQNPPKTSSDASATNGSQENNSIRARLSELNKLLADGLISEDEATERRREILKDL